MTGVRRAPGFWDKLCLTGMDALLRTPSIVQWPGGPCAAGVQRQQDHALHGLVHNGRTCVAAEPPRGPPHLRREQASARWPRLAAESEA